MATSAALIEAMKPKSDQLNADDLITGPITVTITSVKINLSVDQKVAVSYDGDKGKPYKPCKGMMRVMADLWGSDDQAWIGQSMTLYRDPTIKFGPMEAGGIRISHATGMASERKIALTVSKGIRRPHLVKPLDGGPSQQRAVADVPSDDEIARMITALSSAASLDALQRISTHKKSVVIRDWLLGNDVDQCDKVDAAYNEALNRLSTVQPEGRTDEQHGDQFDGTNAQVGLTITDHQANADQIIAAAGNVTTIIDLNNLREASETRIEDMPAEIAALVNGALDGAEMRLKGAK